VRLAAPRKGLRCYLLKSPRFPSQPHSHSTAPAPWPNGPFWLVETVEGCGGLVPWPHFETTLADQIP